MRGDVNEIVLGLACIEVSTEPIPHVEASWTNRRAQSPLLQIHKKDAIGLDSTN